VSVSKTARARARTEITLEIKEAARRQLGEVGAAALSLRAVARELGVVSSALYRYFPNREALLTALIIDAYDALADHAEKAVSRARDTDHLGRWRAACGAIRAWAARHPHEYALVYGSPVPGYTAPDDTIAAGSRIPTLLLGLVRDAWLAGQLSDAPSEMLSEPIAREADHLAAATGLDDLPPGILLQAVIAWTQLFGAISLELFGQLRGAFAEGEVFFTHATDSMARNIGLR
jgi:AcrR family transcriptional regulator